MATDKTRHLTPHALLSREQEELLDRYIQKLDSYFEELKAAEKLRVEIETEHLKKILSR
ncbi:hypothetical protein ACSX1A_03980 [Pontibacter sp. MBLB2868]|uniref:hypothetical protein n=1 Tax=Pontibacter sp. MBLB2868 TaxID=3451555 RepID=UPI003F74EE95